MLNDSLSNLPEKFVDLFQEYVEKITAAAKANKHHDQRRALFIDLLRKAFDIPVDEVELEHKIKAASARGRIDAFYRFVIFEFKSDLDKERDDAMLELTKYFEAQKSPQDYVAAVTDGITFEIYDYDVANKEPEFVRSFKIAMDAPETMFRELDELISASKKVPPTSDEIVARFGSQSLSFSRSLTLLENIYAQVKDQPAVQVKFREWNSLLAKVYGSALGNIDLFLTHTYLTILSRVIVALVLYPKVKRNHALYRGIMTGEFFQNHNIQNLAEPDFFSWALETPSEEGFFGFVENLFSKLDRFDWSALDEDLLKMLYQELVDPGDREELGEYYTPDWLAELALDEIGYKEGRLLDPACGSGTFLFCAIRKMRANGLAGKKLVKTALESVTGLDVHPLAVLMAKANILLALAQELPTFPGDVNIQVYMSDTLLTDEDTKRNALAISVDENRLFYIPLESLNHNRDLDKLIDRMSQFAHRAVASDNAAELAKKGFIKYIKDFTTPEIFHWKNNFNLMVKLVKEKRDTIWAFILKNAFRPAYLRRQKVDVLVANPPWLSLHDVTDAGYKSKIKEMTFAYGLLDKKETKLFTQMDTSTLFFVHCEREFLVKDGKMAFVLPKTVILPAKQHLSFQTHKFSAVHDFTDVKPLFKVRTCLLIEDGKRYAEQIPATYWKGSLPRKNATLSVAKEFLTSATDKFDFVGAAADPSPYFDSIFQGATLNPHNLWFVEVPTDRPLNTNTPFLRTSAESKKGAKDEWKKVDMEGKVEKDVLFATALSEDILPFVIRDLRLLVLPVTMDKDNRLYMATNAQLLGEGLPLASEWVKRAEKTWDKRKKKTEKRRAQERLNYNSLLTDQDIKAPFIVLYNKSGTNIVAGYLTLEERKMLDNLPIGGFIAESVTYRYYANSEDHALYLTAVLNSNIVNDAIKPFQPEGLMGYRDIHRRPFEVCPIPIFEPKNELHQKIVKVGRKARVEMLKWAKKIEGTAAASRKTARDIIASEMGLIDSLVKELLGNLHTPATHKKKALNPNRNLFEAVEHPEEIELEEAKVLPEVGKN